MILTKEQIEKRLSSEKNIVNQLNKLKEESSLEVVYKDGFNHKGNGGRQALTEEERVAIGVVAKVTDNATAAELFNVSERSAKDLKNGLRSTYISKEQPNYNHVDMELKNKINERIENTKLSIQERAAEKLLGTLGLLTEEKLENCSAKDIASISNQMAQVVRNISGQSGQGKGDGKANVKIIVHQPKSIREETFDCIEIGVK